MSCYTLAMENESNVYRLRSAPDLRLRLGAMSLAELVVLDDYLLRKRDLVDLDIVVIEHELDHRIEL